jgi:type II secretory pathway pseudopilin PulG
MFRFYQNQLRPRRGHGRAAPAGFTLIEAAIVTAIVGIGIVAMLELMAAGSMANADATDLTTALGLVSNIHERALGLTYSELFTTFNDMSKTPPIDSKSNVISGLPNWTQTVDIHYVDPNRLTVDVPDTQPEPTARISVVISHNGQTVYTTSWIMSASDWP